MEKPAPTAPSCWPRALHGGGRVAQRQDRHGDQRQAPLHRHQVTDQAVLYDPLPYLRFAIMLTIRYHAYFVSPSFASEMAFCKTLETRQVLEARELPQGAHLQLCLLGQNFGSLMVKVQHRRHRLQRLRGKTCQLAHDHQQCKAHATAIWQGSCRYALGCGGSNLVRGVPGAPRGGKLTAIASRRGQLALDRP